MPADATPTSDTDYAQRFIEQALPLVDQLYSGARRLTASPYDAEDLVQDTMLSGFKGFRLYREGTNLRAWLFRIMYNTWVSGYRARQSRPNEVLCGEFTDSPDRRRPCPDRPAVRRGRGVGTDARRRRRRRTRPAT